MKRRDFIKGTALSLFSLGCVLKIRDNRIMQEPRIKNLGTIKDRMGYTTYKGNLDIFNPGSERYLRFSANDDYGPEYREQIQKEMSVPLDTWIRSPKWRAKDVLLSHKVEIGIEV